MDNVEFIYDIPQINDDDKFIMISVDEEKMKNKNYDISTLSIANLQYYVSDDNEHLIDGEVFINSLKEELGLSKYKCKIILDTLVELDCLKKKGKDYIINPVTAPFLKLMKPTARYCLQHLSSFSFKIYCYLLNKYAIHVKYKYRQNYFFSKSELLRVCGYARSQVKLLEVAESLATLEGVGLLGYNHQGIGRPGHHGTYHELYWVAQVSIPQIIAIKDEEVRKQGILEGQTADSQQQLINKYESLNPIYNDKLLEKKKSDYKMSTEREIEVRNLMECYASWKWKELGITSEEIEYIQNFG